MPRTTYFVPLTRSFIPRQDISSRYILQAELRSHINTASTHDSRSGAALHVAVELQPKTPCASHNGSPVRRFIARPSATRPPNVSRSPRPSHRKLARKLRGIRMLCGLAPWSSSAPSPARFGDAPRHSGGRRCAGTHPGGRDDARGRPALRIPYPILLVLGGLAIGVVPRMPSSSSSRSSSSSILPSALQRSLLHIAS
jgi:hypothetical protein